MLRPVARIPRDKFGVVGPFPLQLQDLPALIFPDATLDERQKVLEGLTFFTTPHTAAEGLGPMSNQAFCLGCHLNTAEGVRSPGLLTPKSCIRGSACTSNAARAARSTPTNFEFTSLNPGTGGGRPADNLDAIDNTGRTAAFTVFGDFDPSQMDIASNPTGIGFFDPLDGTTTNIVPGWSRNRSAGKFSIPGPRSTRACRRRLRRLSSTRTSRVPSIRQRGSTRAASGDRWASLPGHPISAGDRWRRCLRKTSRQMRTPASRTATTRSASSPVTYSAPAPAASSARPT
jgi:hypothetical protein